MNLSPRLDPDAIARQLAAAQARKVRIADDYATRAVPVDQIGHRAGPVHCASILVWARVAELAGVPFIPVETIASIPEAVVEVLMEGDPATIGPEDVAKIKTAGAYCRSGGFWRTELCAGDDVKWTMSQPGLGLPAELPFTFEDMRILEMHYGMPDIKVIGRPRMTPVRVNGYSVEFRVFHGGRATDGAVSFYYPQAGAFEITPTLQAAMSSAREMGTRLHTKRAELGLIPWNPEHGAERVEIGSTIDFMLTEERGLVMVDAGPGWGYGAHPCCFLETEVAGERWTLTDGVELR